VVWTGVLGRHKEYENESGECLDNIIRAEAWLEYTRPPQPMTEAGIWDIEGFRQHNKRQKLRDRSLQSCH
jgi:hypothetical protein